MYQLINSPSYQCCVSVPAAQWPQMREDVAVINSGIDQGQLVGPLSLFLHHLWWFLRAASLEWFCRFTNGRRAGGVPNDVSPEHTHMQTFFYLFIFFYRFLVFVWLCSFWMKCMTVFLKKILLGLHPLNQWVHTLLSSGVGFAFAANGNAAEA